MSTMKTISLYPKAVYKYKATVVHFIRTELPYMSDAMRMTFNASLVAILVQNVLGIKEQEEFTYENWCGLPDLQEKSALGVGVVCNPERLSHTCRLRTSLPDLHSLPGIERDLVKLWMFKDRYGKESSILDWSRDIHGGIVGLIDSCDFSSLERRICGNMETIPGRASTSSGL